MVDDEVVTCRISEKIQVGETTVHVPNRALVAQGQVKFVGMQVMMMTRQQEMR